MINWDLSLYAIRGIPLIKSNDNIGRIIFDCAEENKLEFEEGDVIIVAHKIVSIAENATVKLSDITPSDQANDLAEKTGRDARLCQVTINESSEIVGISGRMIVTWHKLGFKDTSACVDGSVARGFAIVLPKDPDASARRIRAQLKELTKKDLAVIICDTFNDPHRKGTIGVAIGIAGIRHIELRKIKDSFGNSGVATIVSVDSLASAAYPIMGQTEGLPVVVARGARYSKDENASIKNLINRDEDFGWVNNPLA